MKSWADHCSSDEESFNEDTPLDAFEDDEEEEKVTPPEVVQKVEQMEPGDLEAEEPSSHNNNEPPKPRTYEFPSGPPYTLFVGNLSYSIKDGPMLGDALGNLVRDRLQQDIRVVRGKIPTDRNNPQRHKGFGYVEVSSLEEMKLTLELNMDSGAQLAGRKVQLDTANHNTNANANNNRINFNNNRNSSRRQSAPSLGGGEIDGRQFRGGKYDRNNNSSNQNNPKNRRQSEQSGGPPQGQRPSLKLKPRTQPIEKDKKNSQGRSDIFGGAKARDGNAWQAREKQRKEEVAKAPAPAPEEAAPAPAPAEEVAAPTAENNHTAVATNKDHHNKNNRRTSGRGGGGRGGDRHNDNHNNDDNNHQNRRGSNRGGRGRGGRGEQKGRGRGGDRKNKQEKSAPPPPKAAAPAPAPAAAAPAPAPATEKRVSNAFQALAFDDSDSD